MYATNKNCRLPEGPAAARERAPRLFTDGAIVSLTAQFPLMALVHCSLLVSLGLSNNFGMQATLRFEMFWGEHKLTSFQKARVVFQIQRTDSVGQGSTCVYYIKQYQVDQLSLM